MVHDAFFLKQVTVSCLTHNKTWVMLSALRYCSVTLLKATNLRIYICFWHYIMISRSLLKSEALQEFGKEQGGRRGGGRAGFKQKSDDTKFSSGKKQLPNPSEEKKKEKKSESKLCHINPMILFIISFSFYK